MEPFIIMSDYVHGDQDSKWPPFSPTIAKIEHNLIAFCYINMIIFCPFLYFTI